MRLVFGRGIWIGREGAEALHEPMELLPECDCLFLPLCPAEEAENWILPSVGDAVCPQESMAQRKDNSKRRYPPTHGRVEALVKKELPNGRYLCAQVRPKPPEGAEPRHRLTRPSQQRYSPEQILRLAEEMSLVDELDGRPLAEKIRQWQKEEIHLLVCDAVCDDPYNSDALCALREYPGEVLRGLDLAAKVCGNAKTAVVTFRRSLLGLHEMRRLSKVLGSYPQINVSGRYPIWPKLQKKEPFRQGFGRIGVQACIRLSSALYLQHPPERCVVTVGGEGIVSCRNFSVTVGTPVGEVLRYCKHLPYSPGNIRIGGTVNGTAVTEDTPVLQDTRCILLGIPDEDYRGSACIGCGKCNDACCQKIFVSRAVAHEACGEPEMMPEDGIQRCIQCHACSFVCPVGIPIAEKIAVQLQKTEADGKEEAE